MLSSETGVQSVLENYLALGFSPQDLTDVLGFNKEDVDEAAEKFKNKQPCQAHNNGVNDENLVKATSPSLIDPNTLLASSTIPDQSPLQKMAPQDTFLEKDTLRQTNLEKQLKSRAEITVPPALPKVIVSTTKNENTQQAAPVLSLDTQPVYKRQTLPPIVEEDSKAHTSLPRRDNGRQVHNPKIPASSTALGSDFNHNKEELLLKLLAGEDYRAATHLLGLININRPLEKYHGATTLWVLARHKYWDFVHLAIQLHKNANLNATPIVGEDSDLPILFMAIEDHHLPHQFRNIKVIIENGAYVDQSYKDCQPNQYAYQLGLDRKNPQIYKLLTNYRDLFLISILGIFRSFPQATSATQTLNSITSGNEGANLLAITQEGCTPFHLACGGNDGKLYNAMLWFLNSRSISFKKQLLTKRDNKNQTPLDYIFQLTPRRKIEQALQTLLDEKYQQLATEITNLAVNILQYECGKFLDKKFTAQNSGIAIGDTAPKDALAKVKRDVINQITKTTMESRAIALLPIIRTIIQDFLKVKISKLKDLLPKPIVIELAYASGLNFAETKEAKEIVEREIWQSYIDWYQVNRPPTVFLPAFQTLDSALQTTTQPSHTPRTLNKPKPSLSP